MSTPRTIIDRGTTRPFATEPGDRVLPFDAVKRAITAEGLRTSRGRYGDLLLRTYREETMAHSLATRALLRWLACGTVEIEDEGGFHERVAAGALLRHAGAALLDLLAAGPELARVHARVTTLEERVAARTSVPRWRRDAASLHVRTDPWYGIRAGGSVAHLAGVLNALVELGPAPTFLTTDPVPTLRPEVRVEVAPVPRRFRNIGSLFGFAVDRQVTGRGHALCAAAPPGFLYCRHALNSLTGVELSLAHDLPLVLEYNGSEVWIQRHWGGRLRTPELSERVERIALRAAHLVVVVSAPLADEVRRSGVPADRILVVPNGVDPSRCSPEVDGAPVRAARGLGDAPVIGFIGSFGPWHGAAVLVEAFARLVARDPRTTTRLLMIGDGPERAACERAATDAGLADRVVFTGRVDQGEAPAHLSACTVLASPHVPNPDGSPFFGSPTKLFEYMATGKAIVASDLDQLGETLTHDVDALLVPPADAGALATALTDLLSDPERRARLGARARTHAVERHTWRRQTEIILQRLSERVPGEFTPRSGAGDPPPVP